MPTSADRGGAPTRTRRRRSLGCFQSQARRCCTRAGAPKVYVCERRLSAKTFSFGALFAPTRFTYASLVTNRPSIRGRREVEIQAKYEATSSGRREEVERRSSSRRLPAHRHRLPRGARSVGRSAAKLTGIGRKQRQASRIFRVTPAAISLLVVPFESELQPHRKRMTPQAALDTGSANLL